MKKILLIATLLIATMQIFAQQNGDTIISNNLQKVKVRVLYFHIEHRCNTCHSIETNVRKALFNEFQTEINSGIIDLSIINCEDKKNETISKKYDAYGATLAITPFDANHQEMKFEDLTGWAFKTIGKPEVFITELRTKIRSLLN